MCWPLPCPDQLDSWRFALSVTVAFPRSMMVANNYVLSKVFNLCSVRKDRKRER
ncbi:hypothetical protein BT63DRAFT_424245 [Microthyrium microscopicum]|uniref:Uncharacterized protein n=1 Tax=Microthyrium microscopicum TaxID=703497 RepID=A0A6A6UHE5_9PEZI|nr:hypothetical protein BT63DRAFT_424245 [Microthyrium microscopicum]